MPATTSIQHPSPGAPHQPITAAGAGDPKEPTTGLVSDAIDATRDLVRIEIALAREEFDRQAAMAKSAAVPLAAGIGAAIAAATLLLVAVALALPTPWLAATIIGAVLLVVAAALVAGAWRAFPKRPLAQTTGRIADDVTKVKERIA
jgi:hypothetical protein